MLSPFLCGATPPGDLGPNKDHPTNQVVVLGPISAQYQAGGKRSAVPRPHQLIKSATLATFHFYDHCDSAAVFDLKKGDVLSMHRHPNAQISYIIRGAVKVTANKKNFIVRAGRVIVLPPNTPHRFEALEDTIEVDFFGPKVLSKRG